MDIEIREAADEQDVDFIARYFEMTMAMWNDYEVTRESVAEKKDLLINWIKQKFTYFIVAQNREGELVGFNSVWIKQGQRLEKVAKYLVLYVKPEHRQKGVARRLMENAEQWLKDNDVARVEFEVDLNNQRMLDIINETGFSQKAEVYEKYMK